MDLESPHPLMKKLRVLTLSLIFSVALNVSLVAALMVPLLQRRESSLLAHVASPVRAEEGQSLSLGQSVAELADLSFQELSAYLTNKEPVEEGYLKRDLAVSVLTSLHDFYLEKALSHAPLQRREIVLSDGRRVELFPGVSEEQFAAIIRFAYEEKWPLTSKGIFRLFRERPIDESLAEAFLVTPEMQALHVFFAKTGYSLEVPHLLRLVSEGNWELLDGFAKGQAVQPDFSFEKRCRLLLDYVTFGSRYAAQILLRSDFPYVLKRMEDGELIRFLAILREKSPEAEKLCLELLRSPRSDGVWKAAVELLYAYVGEPCPADLQEAMSRFICQASVASSSVLAPAVPSISHVEKKEVMVSQHVVKQGESLWKIARQYGVKVDDLVHCNGLEKDRLFPGMILAIPQQQPPNPKTPSRN